ncbi:Lon-like protease helical domain-containing protein, partial [Limnohabitans sp. DM1]|uniref:Lon-like protease helical domain-containing protein n=1 Tax=Limnohabitans sp. DM1 TaxID=1597955 RepID=UPI000A8B5C0E
MNQPDYNLFVLGEVGSGRTTLLAQMMQSEAAQHPVPSDLCFLHNFDEPEHPRALRLPAGLGDRPSWRKTSPASAAEIESVG